MDQRPPVKGPAVVRLAGWIVLGFSLVGLNPVGIVAGILLLKYADRIAGKVAGKVARRTAATAKLPVTAGAPVDRGLPGRDGAAEDRGVKEVLIPCPFCRKQNTPNAGKCRYCGYAM